MKASFNVCNSIVAVGILRLPYAFLQTGPVCLFPLFINLIILIYEFAQSYWVLLFCYVQLLLQCSHYIFLLNLQEMSKNLLPLMMQDLKRRLLLTSKILIYKTTKQTMTMSFIMLICWTLSTFQENLFVK